MLVSSAQAALAAETSWLSRGEAAAKLMAAADDYNPGVQKTDILKGYSDGSLHEERPVTRAQALVMLRRAFGEVDACETTLGYEPYPEDIDLEGSGVTKETLADLLSVDPELWKAECKGIHEFYAKFGDKLPQRLADELSALEARLG